MTVRTYHSFGLVRNCHLLPSLASQYLTKFNVGRPVGLQMEQRMIFCRCPRCIQPLAGLAWLPAWLFPGARCSLLMYCSARASRLIPCRQEDVCAASSRQAFVVEKVETSRSWRADNSYNLHRTWDFTCPINLRTANLVCNR